MGSTKSTARGTLALVVDSDGAAWHTDYGTIADERVLEVRTRSCRILHGSISWVGSLATAVLSAGQADPLEHWWTVVRTDAAVYCTQLHQSGQKVVRRCDADWEADRCGLAFADKTTDADRWTEWAFTLEQPRFQAQPLRLGDVLEWIVSPAFAPRYCLMTHNCQDYCKALHSAVRAATAGRSRWLPTTSVLGRDRVCGARYLDDGDRRIKAHRAEAG